MQASLQHSAEGEGGWQRVDPGEAVAEVVSILRRWWQSRVWAFGASGVGGACGVYAQRRWHQ